MLLRRDQIFPGQANKIQPMKPKPLACEDFCVNRSGSIRNDFFLVAQAQRVLDKGKRITMKSQHTNHQMKSTLN